MSQSLTVENEYSDSIPGHINYFLEGRHGRNQYIDIRVGVEGQESIVRIQMMFAEERRSILEQWLCCDTEMNMRDIYDAKELLTAYIVCDYLNYILKRTGYSVIPLHLEYDLSAATQRGADLLVVRRLRNGCFEPILGIDIILSSREEYREIKGSQGLISSLATAAITISLGKIFVKDKKGEKVWFEEFLEKGVRDEIIKGTYLMENPFRGITQYKLLGLIWGLKIGFRESIRECQIALAFMKKYHKYDAVLINNALRKLRRFLGFLE